MNMVYRKHCKKNLMPLCIWVCLTIVVTVVNAGVFHTDTWWLNVVKNGLSLYTSIIGGYLIVNVYYKRLFGTTL